MPPSQPILRDGELWSYYFGGKYRSAPEDADPKTGAVCLATLRRDGFVWLDAGPQEGTMLTEPFRLDSPWLFANVDAVDGSLQAEVLDLDGESIERSHPITGDHERYPVQWQQGDPPSSKYRFVQLRFRASRASLYSYWFEQVTEPPPHLVGRTELAQPAVHGRERGQLDDVLAPQPCKRRQRHQPQRMPVEDRATPAEKGSAVLDVETCLRCKVEATPCSQIESIQSTSQLISI